MSDIFISYKHEEQPVARKLADALEKRGWSVWWDPKLRAGEHFDDAIEKALRDAKCVIVMWSKLSVNSRYVKDEATYALNHKKLVPVAIDEVDLPFRFEGIQAAQLIGWDGSYSFIGFQKLVEAIASILGEAQPLIKDEWVIYDSRRKEKLFKILQELDSIVRLHMESINAVVGKLRKDRNIKEAYQNFYDLVREKNFHKDYTDIRRRLKKFSEDDEKKEEKLKCLETLRNALYHFQVAAYMMTEEMPEKGYPSYQLEKAFRSAVDLYDILSDENMKKTNPDKVDKLKEELRLTLNHWPWMQLKDVQQYDLETSENVSNYIEQWIIGWHEHVQMTLHGSPKHVKLAFNYALSKLKNMYDL